MSWFYPSYLRRFLSQLSRNASVNLCMGTFCGHNATKATGMACVNLGISLSLQYPCNLPGPADHSTLSHNLPCPITYLLSRHPFAASIPRPFTICTFCTFFPNSNYLSMQRLSLQYMSLNMNWSSMASLP